MVDGDERILHSSRLLCSACGIEQLPEKQRVLEQVLCSVSLGACRSAMALARGGQRADAVIAGRRDPDDATTLRTGRLEDEGRELFVFFGSRMDSLGSLEDWEKDERIKELACIYSVVEWIEASNSITEFFERLPAYIGDGMRFPEQTVVHSVYRGVPFGPEPACDKIIRTRLVVLGEEVGELQVGYRGVENELLPEEQKMLSEIGRMLNQALARKELSQRLNDKQKEGEEYRLRAEELEQRIESGKRELEEQKRKLGALDSYLERLDRGWEETQSRLESLLKVVPDDVMLIDRGYNVVMTNRSGAEPGDKCHKTFFDSEEPCAGCRLPQVLADRTPASSEIEHGENFYQVHAIPVLNKQQEVEGVVEFHRDVTMEKTYEQQLQQADKLASLGQLVSGIGHEINNPNQFIRGNIKIVRQALEDILPVVDAHQAEHPGFKVANLPYAFFREHIMTLVEDMGHGSERIKGIVEDLKRFARRDEGQLIDTIELNTLIESAARLVKKEVHKRAELKLELDPGLPTFTGNAQKVEQVLVNLIVNAGQAMREGEKGLVTVRTCYEEPDVRIEVQDNGRGMTEQTRKQIFDPFFTTKRAKGGTGLGLAIAYKIVGEHGGSITVESELGRGSLFRIAIPTGPGHGSRNVDGEGAGEAGR